MARKSKFLEDDFSDSEESSEEHELADLSGEDLEEARRVMHSRKRKRTNAKDQATYGIWAEQQDEPVRKRKHQQLPTFVPAQASQTNQTIDEEPVDNWAHDLDSSGQEEDDDEAMDVDESEEEEVRIPREREEEEPLPGGAGIGSGNGLNNAAFAAMARSGIGARPLQAPADTQADTSQPARQPRSFLGASKAAQTPPKPATPLTAEEKRHFAALERQGGIGFQMLSKMGWKSGTGLGTEKEGRINPVDAIQRPQGMGIGFGGFKEKSKQAKVEAKRRGEQVSSDEEEQKPKQRNGKLLVRDANRPERSEAWKAPPRSKKPKVQHRTYEEILQEAGEAAETGVGQIVDLTGAELPSLTSSLSLNVPVPTSDSERLPELRHNLRLIVESAKGELTALAKEGKAVQEKRKWIGGQERKAVAASHDQSERITRLQELNALVQEISARIKQASSPPELFQLVDLQIEQLATNFTRDEFATYKLDQVAVAALAPMMRAVWMDWDPLAEPALYAQELNKWGRIFKPAQVVDPDDMAIDSFGQVLSRPSPSQEMTAYEAMMWTYWLPKVRSAINNSWHPSNPEPALKLYSAWATVLPPFIRDNILDQLVLPKITLAMNDWTPGKSDYTLHGVVLPWLQYAGPRMDQILEDAKRRLKSWLKMWRPRDGIPAGFDLWQSIYEPGEWDMLLLKAVLPTLGKLLRDKFTVDPRDQQMGPLEGVLAWRPYLRDTMVDQLLEIGFFPQWLDALYVWLVSPQVNYDQVGQWYEWWKNWFTPDVQALPGVKNGFAQGISLMGSALDLGADAQYRLAKPVLAPVARQSKEVPGAPKPSNKPKATIKKHPLATETSFRSIVEEVLAENNLILLHTGKSHEGTGQPLFRVSATVNDKKGGVLVYLLEDVLWAQEERSKTFSPLSVQEVVERAKRS